MSKLLTLSLAAVALSGCLRPSAEPEAFGAFVANGQIVRCDLTHDAANERPQPRWIVQLASPLRLKGLHDQEYAQVKVFGLSDTTTFRVGTKLAFSYLQLPQSQQTPWLTGYEWNTVERFPAGYTPNPELLLTNVRVR